MPIPAAASVLVPFDPAAIYPEQVEALLRRVLADGLPGAPAPSTAALHRIPVRYGGSDGPDLEPVAADLGMHPSDVVDLHTALEVEVMFMGFAPGFAYLGELSPRLRVPRLATPRVRVPRGSVAIAGAMTAIYPQASPGGWRTIGRTDTQLFDPASAHPALLRPGDRVRFEPA
jgi:KipI family sensor histidine kinase inhibitor